MSVCRTWYLTFVVSFVVASPLLAQAQEEAPLKMIYAVWKDSTGAASTLKEMDKGAKGEIESYAILIKDKTGKVQVREKHDKAGGSATTLQASQTIDSAIARLSEPASDSVRGYAPNARTSRLSEEDLTKIQGMLGPGESALIILSPHPDIPEIRRSLGMGGPSGAEVVELEVKP